MLNTESLYAFHCINSKMLYSTLVLDYEIFVQLFMLLLYSSVHSVSLEYIEYIYD